uniref:Uncharacterized protein n=1 Tax=Arundo donax TaxID=35708 RepID=A0A0A8ZUL8_ARUDO
MGTSASQFSQSGIRFRIPTNLELKFE